MKSLGIYIFALFMLGSLAFNNAPANSRPVVKQKQAASSFEFKSCRNNCQEFYNICVMRCSPSTPYYAACEDECRTKYGTCYKLCQNFQDQALRD